MNNGEHMLALRFSAFDPDIRVECCAIDELVVPQAPEAAPA